MSFRIRKAAVLGAGVMGSGIAAHLANAGIPVLLLDIVPPTLAPGESRNKFAATALQNLRKQKPAPLMTEKALSLIEIGNFDDDLKRVAECDWVVEVIKEDLKLKNQLFAKLEPIVSKTCIVSSNTSGMSIAGMLDGRSEDFKRRFLVTHFFNPVRYMKLLELVPGTQTDPAVMAAVAEFGERTLGKGIVYGKDTTNFIANRIGTYGMMRTIQLMETHGVTIEEVDKIFGPAMGRPKSAVFRTADIVGLDTFLHVTKNCYDSLPNDPARDTFKAPKWLETMVEKKMLGDKTGAGFYKKNKGDGGKEILVLDLKTFEYRAQNKVRFDSLGAARDVEELGEKIRVVMGGSDKAAKFAEQVTLDTLAYAARLMGEIADDVVNVDRAMRWGFAWEQGPFQTWDAYGVQKGVTRMKELGIPVAPWVDQMLASGRTSFYGADKQFDTYWNQDAKSVHYVPEIGRQVTVDGLKRAG
ncbi:MAG TPA: 3-hydroxyacyl-CoA dehydrogenase family protein, partial [Archangium sp.]